MARTDAVMNTRSSDTFATPKSWRSSKAAPSCSRSSSPITAFNKPRWTLLSFRSHGMRTAFKSDAKRRRSVDAIVKCVVWDLDNTLWDGIMLEAPVILKPGALDIITGLDGRGILQSIASKNDHDVAMKTLESFGISEYFLQPQINWNAKSASIKSIADALNISLEHVAFIDDQPFERDEVNHTYSQVRCIDAAEIPLLLERPEMTPGFITNESSLRRKLYLSDFARSAAEDRFTGPPEEFLASLYMRLSIRRATGEDLRRAEELTV